MEKAEAALLQGSMDKLDLREKLAYLNQLCRDFGGLNPRTKPFEFIRLPPDNKGRIREVPYVTKDGGAQLRKAFSISLKVLSRETIDGVHRVVCQASTPEGRVDEDVGVCNVEGLSGDKLANALMRAETKAKRRATLSITGLGFLDESELDTMPRAEPVPFPDEVGQVEVTVKSATVDQPKDGVPNIYVILEEAKNVGLTDDDLRKASGWKGEWPKTTVVVNRALWNFVKLKKGKTE